MSVRQEPKFLDIPWLVRTILHSAGTNTGKLRIGAFLRMDAEEREALRSNLLKAVTDPNLAAECNRFVDDLASRSGD
jgi:hypothetical protein